MRIHIVSNSHSAVQQSRTLSSNQELSKTKPRSSDVHDQTLNCNINWKRHTITLLLHVYVYVYIVILGYLVQSSYYTLQSILSQTKAYSSFFLTSTILYCTFLVSTLSINTAISMSSSSVNAPFQSQYLATQLNGSPANTAPTGSQSKHFQISEAVVNWLVFDTLSLDSKASTCNHLHYANIGLHSNVIKTKSQFSWCISYHWPPVLRWRVTSPTSAWEPPQWPLPHTATQDRRYRLQYTHPVWICKAETESVIF